MLPLHSHLPTFLLTSASSVQRSWFITALLLLSFPNYKSDADLEGASLCNLLAAHPSAVAWLVCVLPSGLDNHFGWGGVVNDFTEEFEGDFHLFTIPSLLMLESIYHL